MSVYKVAEIRKDNVLTCSFNPVRYCYTWGNILRHLLGVVLVQERRTIVILLCKRSLAGVETDYWLMFWHYLRQTVVLVLLLTTICQETGSNLSFTNANFIMTNYIILLHSCVAISLNRYISRVRIHYNIQFTPTSNIYHKKMVCVLYLPKPLSNIMDLVLVYN